MNIDGVKLWISDGTETGTTVLKYFEPGDESAGYLDGFVNLNETVYFRWSDGYSNESYIWKTDNTEAGTIQVVEDIGDNIKIYGTVNEKIFFSEGIRLWASDGTQTGTAIIFE